MLSDLNEASTKFFSKGNTVTKNKKEALLDIEEWLRSKWERTESRKIGKILLNEAAKSIHPDLKPHAELINKIKLSEHTKANTNEYTSKMLTIINELAFQHWEKSKSSNQRYSSSKEIVYDLQEIHKSIGRPSKAIATIIRPDKVNKAALSHHA